MVNNVKHFKGSQGKDESRYSMILNCEFCACVMQIRVDHCFTDDGFLSKSGQGTTLGNLLYKISYDFG